MTTRTENQIPIGLAGGDASSGSRRSSPQATFVRERVLLFGFLGAAFCLIRLGLLAAFNGHSAIEAVQAFISPGPSLANAITAACFFLVAGLARLVPAGSISMRAVDLGGFFLIATAPLWAVAILSGEPAVATSLTPLLGFALIAMWRSAIVPSHPLHTFGVVLIAGLGNQSVALVHSTPDYPINEALSYVVVTAIVSMTTSQVIYRLYRRARSMEQLGQYRLEVRIGGGGMGEVFRASHALMRRPVAIKILRVDAQDSNSVQRFEREVRLTATLEHPNTISVYDFGQTPEGQVFYVMELLRGLDLERIVQTHGPLPPGRAIHILRQACGALGEAHDKGIIHRDVKPANMLLCELGGIHDFTKMLDFGLVKQMAAPADQALTGDLGLLGTPLYLSPEAIRAQDQVDARSDIYSLGCVAYQLLTGEKVFVADSIVEICHAHLNEAPIPPSKRVDFEIPSDLEEVIMRCLEKDPQLRPQSMRQLTTAFSLCRDADTWGETEAAAWWKEHMPKAMPCDAVAKHPDGGASFHETFEQTGEATRHIQMPTG